VIGTDCIDSCISGCGTVVLDIIWWKKSFKSYCFAARYKGDFQKNEDFSFSENNLNIKWYERKVNILKQAQW
jgi:hypothetical protein